MRFPSILALAIVVVSSVPANAQLFQRWGRAQASSSCPGGVCPASGPVATAVAAPQLGHWSYPGTIDSHLEGTHGVSTAGMSRQQKLDLHDSLHEGTAPAVRRATIAPRGVYQSVGKSGSYGSSGGSSGTFRVGSRDKDGAVITSISEPVGKHVYSAAPQVAPKAPKAACSCGEKCQCGCGDDLTNWDRPNLDFGIEPKKQYYVRKEDVERMPTI